MRNITISVDEEVARWARVWTAENDTSLSRMVGEMLRERMQRDDAYEAAKREFHAIVPRPLGKKGDRYPKRDELYDRKVLRRR